jgi:hypothetical protein
MARVIAIACGMPIPANSATGPSRDARPDRKPRLSCPRGVSAEPRSHPAKQRSPPSGVTSKATLTALAPTPVEEFGTVWNVAPTRDPTACAVARAAEDDAAPVVGASAISDVLHEASRLRRSDNRGTIRRCCQRVRGTAAGGNGAAGQQCNEKRPHFHSSHRHQSRYAQPTAVGVPWERANQGLDLYGRRVLPGSNFGVPTPDRSNCSI